MIHESGSLFEKVIIKISAGKNSKNGGHGVALSHTGF
jgi:hypothetical protein